MASTGSFTIAFTRSPFEHEQPRDRAGACCVAKRSSIMPRILTNSLAVVAALLVFLDIAVPAAEPDFAARARAAYRDAQAKYARTPKDNEMGWQFARACFDVADFST